MSYTLTPIIVDLAAVKALMGSKKTAVLQAVIKKHRRAMVEADSQGESFEDFEKQIKAEYKAFAAGNFSSVDLNGSYSKPRHDKDGKWAKLAKEMNLSGPGAAKKAAELWKIFFG